MKPSEAYPLIAVVGPTASGKSDLALHLAREFRGEIINCDSMQVYRWFDIGTATPSPAERGNIPHHLMDILAPYETLTAGEYARRARAVLEDIRGRGTTPIFVGGTGFYLRSLLEGLFPGPQRNEDMRARLAQRARTRPAGYLHRILRRLDADSAARIHANDTPKLIRAIEVRLQARRPMSALFRESQGHGRLEGYRAIKLGLDPPRRELYERINRRAELMFESGLLDEVRAILARGVSPKAKPFESHGYMEALAVVEGRMSLPEAIASTQLRTRQYAKRQMTWFRKEKNLQWIRGFGDDRGAKEEALRFSDLAI